MYDHIYNWFDYLLTKKIIITGYVMPNHLHILIYAGNISTDINKIIGNGKRFMAYEIINRLEKSKRLNLLTILQSSILPSEKLKGKLHNVFEPSFDIKEITTEKFLVQKLNYIHQNPVRGKWKLVDDYRKYKHSSAGYYELGNEGEYNVIHYEKAGVYFDKPSES
jgi:REP element-mobilizing transposase RayT